MADQLATATDLALLPGVDPDLPEDTKALLIECATAVVQAVCGGQRIVQVVNDQVVIDLDGHDVGAYLRLPQRPVTAVATVLVGSSPVTDWSAQLSRGRLWRPSGWRSTLLGYPLSQPSGVTVTYTHGYPTGDQRLQLARSAVLSLAAGAASGSLGVAREQIDDYSVQYEAMAARMEASPFLMGRLRGQYGRPARSARLVAPQ
ncbi:hypothetical protein [Micromonospora robiginosa]|uniref:Uncharacterized protein n=1 Tax=Micromonospora robiginosa TaxID=2749844 RepID=A0A7L6B7N4_9ACTN|nr:hypothetical protein [Micromonospora ferruginea]QLQ37986.1 hypothetical protein H1D33_03580 [Micromonospora ferruginea]